ncbi:pentapeptide repeat-containing protein [Candidatus Cyanaurora vandensis]|uniref:pentapeptide repeat-containing protein n=1 Tax=Candidatus Cyanaurora vandensis TaxID=2714958 RepID=UPI002579B1F4|nr:pentapeptide repeat-containing protein [Candidatus Cyanaurora vandensis]
MDLPQDLKTRSQKFLQQSPHERLTQLRLVGLARYGDFLTQMPLTEANVRCVMGFLADPTRVKFPQLAGATLAGLDLTGVNFIRGDLRGADLRGSRLYRADLIFAYFDGADLTGADLTGATCHRTQWQGAQVVGCRFGAGVGLTPTQQADLQARGAVLTTA